MVIRTFLDKCNTIVKDSNENFGMNPILMLHYGSLISRIILHFDIDNIKNNIGNNIDNYIHKLIMVNCCGVNNSALFDSVNSFNGSRERVRANSFDVIAFEIPSEWDGGNGMDSSLDFWLNCKQNVSKNSSTWYQAYNGKIWEEEGIYSNSYLSNEYSKYGNNQNSIIISRQHFDVGNENLELDITDYVKKILKGKKKNNGICVAFSPLMESTNDTNANYVGFFSEHTNTFYHPVVESRSIDNINDNRYDFQIGKENKLYLYVENDGNGISLDKTPVCIVNNKEYDSKEEKKGVYSVNVKLNKNEVDVNSIIYDTWTNLELNGETLDDVELEFVVQPRMLMIGSKKENRIVFEPQLKGINMYEKINRGDVREINVYYREKYNSSTYHLINDSEYRLYIKDGNKEFDVIEWDKIDKISNYNSFIINTNGLLPNNYLIDIKCKIGNEIKIFKHVLEFNIIDIIKNSSL